MNCRSSIQKDIQQKHSFSQICNGFGEITELNVNRHPFSDVSKVRAQVLDKPEETHRKIYYA